MANRKKLNTIVNKIKELQNEYQILKYGTSAGANAAWDTRGRGTKETPKGEKQPNSKIEEIRNNVSKGPIEGEPKRIKEFLSNINYDKTTKDELRTQIEKVKENYSKFEEAEKLLQNSQNEHNSKIKETYNKLRKLNPDLSDGGVMDIIVYTEEELGGNIISQPTKDIPDIVYSD